MFCYTTTTTSSWVKVLLLFLLSCAMQVPGLAMMTTMHNCHHHLRNRHHHITSMQNNNAKVLNANSPVLRKKNSITNGGYDLIQSVPYRSLEDEVTTRNRTRPDNDGCDSGWERKNVTYYSNMQEVWTDPICYSYELSLSCYCAPEYTKPMRIEVYNDTVTNVTFLDKDPTVAAVVPEDRQRPTMNMLFDILYEDCFAGCPDSGAQECTITYDSVNGNIETLFIDYSKLAADDELRYSITNFELC